MGEEESGKAADIRGWLLGKDGHQGFPICPPKLLETLFVCRRAAFAWGSCWLR